MKTYIVDLETSVGGGKGRRAWPFFPGNNIVAVGHSHDGRYVGRYLSLAPHSVPEFISALKEGEVLLVGHNITFDLLWLMAKHPTLVSPSVLKNIHLWDTQQVAYLLSAQDHMYPSLDEVSAELGLPLKDDRIKEYWAAGLPTEKIPSEELMEYLEQDVRNTEKVYHWQREILKSLPKLHNLAKIKHQDILATTAMTYFGMYFDLGHALELRDNAMVELRVIERDWAATVGPLCSMPMGIASSADVGLLLFGGTKTDEVYVEARDADGKPVVYKTGAKAGTIKLVKEKRTVLVKNQYLGKSITERGKSGKWKVDDTVLSEVATQGRYPVAQRLANLVLRHRALQKEISTYLEGYSSLVDLDGVLRPNYQHCSTRTGRMSCSSPNLQNVTKNGED